MPMEVKSRIIGSSTPRFAKMVSWKYGHLPASKVSEDLEVNHRRKTSRKLIQALAASVGEIAREKEFEWAYDLPQMPEVVTHISVSRDGTTTPILNEGYRETMCGTISFYSAKGIRMHTIYTACAPEHGKESFDQVMDMELAHVKKQYPSLPCIGLADGAKNNWTYLNDRTDVQILDFFHLAEHLAEVSPVLRQDPAQQRAWLDQACHDLKHKKQGAKMILHQLKSHQQSLPAPTPQVLDKTITYLENNLSRTQYAQYQQAGYPIGSGITEAACKVIAKQRLSNSGMRWTIHAAEHILLLRGLICTHQRWDQFWKHISDKGI